MPPQGAPGGSWLACTLPGGDTGPLGSQPLPRVLELAASKAAHVHALFPIQVKTQLSLLKGSWNKALTGWIFPAGEPSPSPQPWPLTLSPARNLAPVLA
jgi:hypothetical protein